MATTTAKIHEHWREVVAECQSGKCTKDVVRLSVIYLAVSLAHARAERTYNEYEHQPQQDPKRAEKLFDRYTDLENREGEVHSQVAHEPGFSLITPHLKAAFVLMKGIVQEANNVSQQHWTNGGSPTGRGVAQVTHMWEQARIAKESQINALAAIGISRIMIEEHIIDPLKKHYGVDATTLTEMGLNIDMRQNAMGKRTRMPLHAMGYRQRLQYAGSY